VATDLQGNQSPLGWPGTTTFLTASNRGLRFQVTTAGYFTRIGYYRPGAGTFYDNVRLYGPTGGVLAEWASITDDGSAGWHWLTLTTPVAAATTTTYTISGHNPSGTVIDPGWAQSNRDAAPAPFLWDDGGQWYVDGAPAWPTSGPQSYFQPLSVTWSQYAAGEPSAGEGDATLTGDLASWLSQNAAIQTHETDGLPWHIGLVVDALTTTVNNIGAAIGHVADAASTTGSLMARVAQLLLDTAAILARIPADILNSIEQFVSWISSWFGDAPRPSDAPTLPAQLNEVWGRTLWLMHRLETAHWIDAVPGGDWVLQDTISWDGPLGWNQPADCYVFRITTVPPWAGQEDIDGHIRYIRAAWWMPLSDTFPHDRHSADMDVQVLEVLPRRCSGILLRPSEGFAGTLEAWLRPDPPTS
jgi:hypothetical protein